MKNALSHDQGDLDTVAIARTPESLMFVESGEKAEETLSVPLVNSDRRTERIPES